MRVVRVLEVLTVAEPSVTFRGPVEYIVLQAYPADRDQLFALSKRLAVQIAQDAAEKAEQTAQEKIVAPDGFVDLPTTSIVISGAVARSLRWFTLAKEDLHAPGYVVHLYGVDLARSLLMAFMSQAALCIFSPDAVRMTIVMREYGCRNVRVTPTGDGMHYLMENDPEGFEEIFGDLPGTSFLN